jgi:hypothetical protein
VEGLGQWLYPQLGSLRINQAYLTGSDPIVDPELVVGGCGSYAASLLSCTALETRQGQASESDARPNASMYPTHSPGIPPDCGRVGIVPPRRTARPRFPSRFGFYDISHEQPLDTRWRTSRAAPW